MFAVFPGSAGGDRMSDERPADEAGLSVELHGPAVTIKDAIEAGDATKRMLDSIGKQLGVVAEWQVAAVYFKCDGCGLRRPDRPGPDEGWSHANGDDFCPACSGALGVKP